MSNGIVFADEKKGYNKEQVNRYIEELTRRCEAALAAKDRELSQVRDQLEQTQRQWNAVSEEYQAMKADKERIATALIDAQARAEQIMEDAKKEAEAEKEALTREADDKRDLLVARNKMLRDMRLDVTGLLDTFKQTLDQSHRQILQTLEADFAKFTDDLQGIRDAYPQGSETEENHVEE